MVTVTVFGGSGFLGLWLAARLLDKGMTARVAVRHPDRARAALKTAGIEHAEVVSADLRERAAVSDAIAGADAVVNAVSAYVDRHAASFAAVHERGAETVATAAAEAGIARLVLVSGIGANAGARAPYIRSRGRGEALVTAAFPGATIVRPSAMFGPRGGLFGAIAGPARFLPALPLIGGGGTRLQPVSVEDVAEAIARIIVDPGTAGRTYEFGGPEVYTLRALTAMVLKESGRRRPLLPLPFALAGGLARLSELTPWPPLTRSAVDLLREDNLASGDLPGLADLGIEPTTLGAVLKRYTGRRGAAAERDWM